MAQQNEPNLSDREMRLLERAAEEYGLADIHDALASRDAWDDRIQIAFSHRGGRVLLKQWPRYCVMDSQIAFSLGVQDRARDCGAPVPAVHVTVGGERVLDFDLRRFSLHDFRGTAHDPERPAQLLACAAALGRLHSALADFEVSEDMESGLGVRCGVSLSAGHLARMCSAVADGEVSGSGKRHVLEVLREASSLHAEAVERVRRLGWDDLPAVAVHGDYHQFNCRFDGDELVAIVDFDNCRLEPRLYDVAYASDFMLALDWRRESEQRGLWRTVRRLDAARVFGWLEAYSRFAPPLSDDERRMLPSACAVVWPEVIQGFAPTRDDEVAGCESVTVAMRPLLDAVWPTM